MLYAFGFQRVGVVAGDLYFLNPDPEPGQEGPEQGVRLEVRLLERGELPGSIYSAQPIAIDRPVWRADLLESVDHPGSLDRAHHHPEFRGWEPGPRRFDEAMSADPVAWVGRRLGDLPTLVDEAGLASDSVATTDADDLRAAVAEIVDVVHRLLDRVRKGELAQPPRELVGDQARLSWL
jgi:hypothetical protein